MPTRLDTLARLSLAVLMLGTTVLRAQTDEPATETTSIEDDQAAETTSIEDDQAAEPEVRGRLTITADAPATITIDGEDFGLLEPGSSLAHESTLVEGTVQGKSAENPDATVSERYSFKPKEEEEDEEEGDKDEVTETETEAETEPDAEAEADESEVDGPSTEIRIELKINKAVRDLNKKQRQGGVYADFKRGIMWRREDNRANLTWKAAARYCDALIFGGWSNWRLPTIDELDSLQALWSQAAFKTIDPIKTSACCQWSISEIDDTSAWHYNFRFRRSFEGQKGFSYDLRALCVRTLSDEEIQEREETLVEKKKDKKKKKKVVADDEEFLGTVEEVSGSPTDDDLPLP